MPDLHFNNNNNKEAVNECSLIIWINYLDLVHLNMVKDLLHNNNKIIIDLVVL
jgi:hypothetical protein